MNHEFILIDVDEIPQEVCYNLKDGRDLIVVDDDVIVNNSLFLTGFKTFKISLKNSSEGLDYYGNTVIPLSSIDEFIDRIEIVRERIKNKKFFRQLNELIALLERAKAEKKYVIHFGI